MTRVTPTLRHTRSDPIRTSIWQARLMRRKTDPPSISNCARICGSTRTPRRQRRCRTPRLCNCHKLTPDCRKSAQCSNCLLLNCLYIFQALIRPLVTERTAQDTRAMVITQLPWNSQTAFTVGPQRQQNVQRRLSVSNFRTCALKCQAQ